MKMHARVLSRVSYVRLFAPEWTEAHQAPLSLRFPREEYWSGLPFPSPRDLPNPRIEPRSLVSPVLARWILYHCATWEVPNSFITPPLFFLSAKKKNLFICF